MSNRSIVIFASMTADQKEEYKALVARDKSLKDDWEALKNQALNLPDVKVAARLAAYDGKPTSEISEGPRFKITFGLYQEPAPKVEAKVSHSAYVAPEYVDPKIINALLNGKLITDAEKRSLLMSVYPRAMALLSAVKADAS